MGWKSPIYLVVLLPLLAGFGGSAQDKSAQGVSRASQQATITVYSVPLQGDVTPQTVTPPSKREGAIPIPTAIPPGKTIPIPREISAGKVVPAEVTSATPTARVVQREVVDPQSGQ